MAPADRFAHLPALQRMERFGERTVESSRDFSDIFAEVDAFLRSMIFVGCTETSVVNPAVLPSYGMSLLSNLLEAPLSL